MRAFFAWIVWVLAVSAAVLSAQDKWLDKWPLLATAKGTDIRLTHGQIGSPPGLWLKLDFGAQDCILRIQVKDQTGAFLSSKAIDCKLIRSTQKLTWETDTRDKNWLEIRDAGGGMVQWPNSAAELELQTSNANVRELRLVDWEIHPKNNTPYDSMARAAFRFWWYWISAVLLVVGTIYAFAGYPVKAKQEASLGRQDVLQVVTAFHLIGQVQGADDQETLLMQRLLALYVLQERHDILRERIWESTRYRTDSQRWTIWFQTFSLFNTARHKFDALGIVPPLP